MTIKQLLTEKEKGCGKYIRNTMEDEGIFCGIEFTYYEDEIDDPDLIPHKGRELCDKCQAEISILKICEKEREERDKEEIGFLVEIGNHWNMSSETRDKVRKQIKVLKEQLNNQQNKFSGTLTDTSGIISRNACVDVNGLSDEQKKTGFVDKPQEEKEKSLIVIGGSSPVDLNSKVTVSKGNIYSKNDTVEHYKKYGVTEGDKLLLETAKNNYQKGYENALEEFKKNPMSFPYHLGLKLAREELLSKIQELELAEYNDVDKRIDFIKLLEEKK